jgi:hypothetical protein
VGGQHQARLDVVLRGGNALPQPAQLDVAFGIHRIEHLALEGGADGGRSGEYSPRGRRLAPTPARPASLF